ncbi:MAG: hypothetical protein IKD10_01085 [Lentisphaeria bacterium]|nr:hypothetical protein [Lentisphaeria bacterium]MBR7143510.1 hypothetical protein [Lentisphaeria bacterium]
MRKASGKAEYRRIAAELELAIRCGEYVDKLDHIQILADRFNVAKQTMTNALQLLRSYNIIEHHGRAGIHILRENLPGGVIAIIGKWSDEYFQENYDFIQPLIAEFEKSGYHFVVMRVFSSSMEFLNQLELSNFAGLIFNARSITETLAQRLADRKIPFVSISRLPLYPDMDYVNFDTEKSITQLASDLKAAGYRKIALLFPSQTEGYNQLLHKMWKKIKRQLALEILSCDKICHQDDLSWEDNAVNYLKKLAAMPEKPEVLIHYGSYSTQRQELYKQAVPDYPCCMRIVHVASTLNEEFAPNNVVFANAKKTELLKSAFTLLLERMRSPEAPIVHRLIPYNIEYLQKI